MFEGTRIPFLELGDQNSHEYNHTTDDLNQQERLVERALNPEAECGKYRMGIG